MPPRFLFPFVATLLVVVPVTATTYPQVTFDELIARSDVIFVGEVADVRPFPVNTRERTVIKTRVVFRVQDALFGTNAVLEVLDFFGGEWGGVGMAIAEMPRFAVGDRRVVFARREQSINPIVGFTQGLLVIRRDTSGVDRILTLAGIGLDQPERIGARTPAPQAATTAMSLSTFRAHVVSALRNTQRR
jgi:hypothetical protein